MTALGTRLLEVEIDSETRSAEVTNCRITSAAADADVTTFKEAKEGGAREYKLAFDAVQDLAEDTLWDLMWAAAGTTVAVLLKPYGNEVASATQPHYSGNVTITEPDGDLLGGAANSSTTSRWTFSAEWTFAAKPTKITTAG